MIGESKPTFVTAITSRALSVGEYIKISSDEGEILGLVERSSVSSAAFTDVRNFDEAVESTEIAELARKHNDANICALPARFIDNNSAEEIVNVFLNTDFEGGRHQLRIDKIPIK